jgi:hypothetical protein
MGKFCSGGIRSQGNRTKFIFNANDGVKTLFSPYFSYKTTYAQQPDEAESN